MFKNKKNERRFKNLTELLFGVGCKIVKHDELAQEGLIHSGTVKLGHNNSPLVTRFAGYKGLLFDMLEEQSSHRERIEELTKQQEFLLKTLENMLGEKSAKITKNKSKK